MEVVNKPRVIKILSGAPDLVEDQIAALGNDYAITHWHFYAHEGMPRVMAVLIHGSVIRQMMIAGAPQNGPRMR